MNSKSANDIDSFLRAFLQTTDLKEAEDSLAALLEKQVEPLVRKTLRGKLRVSLQPDDERRLNQDALDLADEVKTLILSHLRHLKDSPETKKIEKFDAYVRTVTLNAYHQYLRRQHPFRLRLKNQLRYLLTRHRDFLLRETAENVWICGRNTWPGSSFRSDFSMTPADLRVDSPAAGNGFRERSDLIKAVTAVFDHFQKPILFENLVTIIGEMQGIKEPSEIDMTEKAAENLPVQNAADALSQLEQRDFLGRLWVEIGNLPLRHRTVLLLNLRDPHGDNLIALLPLMRIATIRQIAGMLEFPAEEFARVWNELPWDDRKIADRLDLTRQQVINLRQSARAALRKRLKNF